MQRERYESVGNLTFCFDKVPRTTAGTVTFAVRQGREGPSLATPSMSKIEAPEDPNGLIRLRTSEDDHIIRAIGERIRADSSFLVRGRFKNVDTGAVTAWTFLAHVTRKHDGDGGNTVTYSFFSGFSSEYPTDTADLTQC